jgi:cytochrome c oxidase assembly protein subunit 15
VPLHFRRQPKTRAVAAWLFLCAASVLAMVVIGGITRLTKSGLSIVEWNPVLGALPPLTDADWNAAYAAYQASPEGQLVNHGMDLASFQEIFFVEWLHRLVGRLVGVVVLVPLVFFALTRRLSGKRAARVLGIFALGGLQGFLGWFMVKSGLESDPQVSPYRLTMHLGMALLIFSLLLWNAFDEGCADRGMLSRAPPSPVRPFAWATLLVVGVTIAWGGMMAGLHAGLVAPTFPDINGAFIPDGMFGDDTGRGFFANLVGNALTVHFAHRVLAGCAALGTVVTVGLAFLTNAPRAARGACVALVGFVALQVLLGALTVLHHVPIPLAALHQLNGALVLGSAVALVHALRR